MKVEIDGQWCGCIKRRVVCIAIKMVCSNSCRYFELFMNILCVLFT